MKKKMIAMLLVAGMTLSLAACGNSAESASEESTEETEESSTESTETDESTESTESSDSSSQSVSTDPYSEPEYTALDYVTLGDYSAFQVELDETDYQVSESDINDYIDEMIENQGSAYQDDDTQDTVQDDSIIKADYVGKIDGEAFDGGSSTDSIIDVAGNCEAEQGYSYITGFTDGLAGAKVGDSVDVTVTFPENYSEEDLAGKEAVFTFTIKAIEKYINHDTIEDEYISDNFGYENLTVFKKAAQEALQNKNQSQRESDIVDKCVEQLIETSEISGYPEDMIDSRYDYSYQKLENAVFSYYAMSMDEYAAYQGMTIDEYEDYLKEQLETSAKSEMILKAIAETENLEVDSKGYSEFVQNLLSVDGYDDEDALYAAYAKDYVEYSYLISKAKDMLYNNTTVIQKDSEDTEAAETEAESAETEASEDDANTSEE